MTQATIGGRHRRSEIDTAEAIELITETLQDGWPGAGSLWSGGLRECRPVTIYTVEGLRRGPHWKLWSLGRAEVESCSKESEDIGEHVRATLEREGFEITIVQTILEETLDLR